MICPWEVSEKILPLEGLLETSPFRRPVRGGLGGSGQLPSLDFLATSWVSSFRCEDMVKRFLISGRMGFYVAVTREGEVGAGDEIKIISRDPQCRTGY